jgi:hypothetical protein
VREAGMIEAEITLPVADRTGFYIDRDHAQIFILYFQLDLSDHFQLENLPIVGDKFCFKVYSGYLVMMKPARYFMKSLLKIL